MGGTRLDAKKTVTFLKPEPRTIKVNIERGTKYFRATRPIYIMRPKALRIEIVRGFTLCFENICPLFNLPYGTVGHKIFICAKFATYQHSYALNFLVVVLMNVLRTEKFLIAYK